MGGGGGGVNVTLSLPVWHMTFIQSRKSWIPLMLSADTNQRCICEHDTCNGKRDVWRCRDRHARAYTLDSKAHTFQPRTHALKQAHGLIMNQSPCRGLVSISGRLHKHWGTVIRKLLLRVVTHLHTPHQASAHTHIHNHTKWRHEMKLFSTLTLFVTYVCYFTYVLLYLCMYQCMLPYLCMFKHTFSTISIW